MAIYRIRTGRRGRPATIDTKRLLDQALRYLPKAKYRLTKIREQTHGERNEDIIGSETMLPKAIESAIDVLQSAERGAGINASTARELSINLRMLRQLASPQGRVYNRALAETLVLQYEGEIEYQRRYASSYASKIYKEMLANVKKLSPQQQQVFFLSRYYQSVKTNQGMYKAAIAWAENDLKKKTGLDYNLTGEEALAYCERDKLATSFEEMGVEYDWDMEIY